MYVVAYCISTVSGFFGIMRSAGELSDNKLTRSATSVASHANVLRLVTRPSPRASAQRTSHFRLLAVSLCFERINLLFSEC